MWPDNQASEQPTHRTFIETVRRAQIVEHTIEVLAEVGYGRASLALIAERAGISKGVISYHFKGKADLVHQVEVEVIGAMRAAIDPQIEAESTATGQLNAFIRANLEYMRDHRSHLLALIEIFFMHARGQQRRPSYEAFDYEPIFQALEEIFRHGQQTGEFTSFDTRVMAVATWAAIEGMFTQWAAYPDLDLDRHITELITLFNRAVRSGQG